MTFLQITDAILLNLFDESSRSDAKNWCNHRYGWILAMEEWAFLNATATVTVTAGSQTVSSLPSDFGIALGLWDSDGRPLRYMTPQAFLTSYNTNLDSAGSPEAYTVIGDTILVGPTPDTTATDWQLAYELDGTPMSADGDIPIIPELFHVALIHGGRAEGMKLQHNPTWRDVEQDFLASIDAMKRRYLVKVRQAGEQVPAYRPG